MPFAYLLTRVDAELVDDVKPPILIAVFELSPINSVFET
jgi:hypothetical protein